MTAWPSTRWTAATPFATTSARAAGRRPVPRSILPAVGWAATTPFVERYATLSTPQLNGAAAGCRRLWFVSSHEGQTDGPARSRANRAEYHALDRALERAFGPGRIEQYGYASPIHVQLLAGGGAGARIEAAMAAAPSSRR